MASRRPFEVPDLLPPPPTLELPPITDQDDDNTSHIQSFGTPSIEAWTPPASESPTYISRAAKAGRLAPPPLPPKESAPAPPVPAEIEAGEPADEEDLVGSSHFAPAEWAEIEEWQQKGDTYVARVHDLLAQKSQQFDALFDSFFDELRIAVRELHVPLEAQLDIIRDERERIEAAKVRLFAKPNAEVFHKHIREKKAAIRNVIHVVRAQAVIRGFLQRKKFNQLWRPLKRRNRVVTEIIDTENAYVKHLENCLEFFYTPLAQREKEGKEPLVPSQDLSLIFGNLIVIVNINREFLKDLEKQLTSWQWTKSTLGDVFVRFAPFLKSYTSFVNNYELVQKAIQSNKAKSSEFVEFLKIQGKNPKLKGQDLFSYLIMPIQRIPRYELLLKELQKQTPESHPDTPLLAQAIDAVHAIAVTINDQKKLNENMMKMMQIQAVLGSKCPDLIQPHRRLVKEGSVQLVQHGGSDLVSCYIFLFNDSLLLTQMNTAQVNITSNLIFRHFQTLQHCRVELLSPQKEFQFGFEIFFPQVVIQLCVPDEEKRTDWVNSIQDGIQFFTSSSSSRLSARLSMRMDSSSALLSPRSGAVSENRRASVPSFEPPQPQRGASAPGPKKTMAQLELEQFYEEAIVLSGVLQQLPKELQTLVVNQARAQSALEANLLLKVLSPAHLAEMRENLAALRAADLTEALLKRRSNPSANAASALADFGQLIQEGKALVTEMKNFVVANFPSGTQDPRNETPRQLVVKLMKWFMGFEQRLLQPPK